MIPTDWIRQRKLENAVNDRNMGLVFRLFRELCEERDSARTSIEKIRSELLQEMLTNRIHIAEAGYLEGWRCAVELLRRMDETWTET